MRAACCGYPATPPAAELGKCPERRRGGRRAAAAPGNRPGALHFASRHPSAPCTVKNNIGLDWTRPFNLLVAWSSRKGFEAAQAIFPADSEHLGLIQV